MVKKTANIAVFKKLTVLGKTVTKVLNIKHVQNTAFMGADGILT